PTMVTTCSGVLPWQKTASGAPLLSGRWVSTLAKPTSAYGRSRSCRIAASTGTRPAETSSRSARSFSRSITPRAPRVASTSSARLAFVGRPRSATLLKRQRQVGAAALEPRQVHRDVDVAELSEPSQDLRVTVLLPEARDVLDGKLEAGQPVVVPDAELPEPEPPHERLRRVDPAELLGGDRIAVLEARRQAGEGRLVPGRQPKLPGERADLLFPELRLDQGRPHPPLPGRLHAGPVVAEVVDVGPVDERLESQALGDRLE